MSDFVFRDRMCSSFLFRRNETSQRTRDVGIFFFLYQEKGRFIYFRVVFEMINVRNSNYTESTRIREYLFQTDSSTRREIVIILFVSPSAIFFDVKGTKGALHKCIIYRAILHFYAFPSLSN